MSVELNHTIVHCKDNRESAEFFADLLDLTVGEEWGPFIPVVLANSVTLDFATIPAASITPQHYAFLVSEAEFDSAFAKIQARESSSTPIPTRSTPARSTTMTAGGACTSLRSRRSLAGADHPPVRRLTGSRSSGRSHITAGGRARTVPTGSAPMLR